MFDYTLLNVFCITTAMANYNLSFGKSRVNIFSDRYFGALIVVNKEGSKVGILPLNQRN